jgi:Flp pilus assembly protein TadB
MFLRRDRQPGEGRTLVPRTVAFAVGAGLALAGIALDLTWLVNVAIGVLLLAFLLRFAGGR